MNPHQEIDDALPLTEVTTFILLSLVDEPKHGYAIMKDVEGLSEARVQISTGTLYGALSRLLDQGWIARWEADEAQEETPGRPRKTYILTQVGWRVLDAEIRRLRSVVAVAQVRTAEAPV